MQSPMQIGDSSPAPGDSNNQDSSILLFPSFHSFQDCFQGKWGVGKGIQTLNHVNPGKLILYSLSQSFRHDYHKFQTQQQERMQEQYNVW